MGLSTADIAAVVAELAPAVATGWIQKIHQPDPDTLTLEVRRPGRTLTLLISTDPAMARLHLTDQPPPNPPSPPPFCQFLRAHVQGARIDAIAQVPDDRIVRLALTTREGPRTLVAELTGRYANLLLLNERETIVAGLHEMRDRLNHIYQPPAQPAQAGPASRDSSFTPDPAQPFPVSAAIDAHYRRHGTETANTRLRQARLNELKKSIKKSGRRIEALKDDLDKAARYQDYARYGELLKANLGSIKKGQERVTVTDYFDPAQPELVIPLDASRTPQGNMDDYFKKHRKYLAAQQEIAPRIEQIERELTGLRTELAAIQQDTWTPPAPPFVTSRTDRSRSRPQPSALSPQHSKRSGPFRRFESADGLPIYVGRNAKENEELSLKFAHSEDLWLHAHGVPGSHVVVRLEKGMAVPPETLRDAATLALLYSDLKKSGKGEVIYTKGKHVKKAKGRPPGTVTVTQEKAVHVSLDRARLDRLKESR